MPIQAIILQPSTNDLMAAYRPIVFRVEATKTGGGAVPPVVFCDIYFDNVYYKSLSKTQYDKLNVSSSEFEFDIADAVQEVLKFQLPDNGGTALITASNIFKKVFCKFRSSGYDSNGFIVVEGTTPIQSTGSQAPVSGTGTQSNECFVVNSSLQHEDNQDLKAHLNSYKTGNWAANAYPLTHRPNNYKICKSDSDYFPIINLGNEAICIRLKYKTKDGQNLTASNCPIPFDLEFGWNKNANETIDLTGKINGTLTSINWGDGTVDTNLSHTYVNAGNYIVGITGTAITTLIIGNKIGVPIYKVTSVNKWPSTLTDINLLQSTVLSVPSISPLTNLEYFRLSSPNLQVMPIFININNVRVLQIVNSMQNDCTVDLSNLDQQLEIVELHGNNITDLALGQNNCTVFVANNNKLNVSSLNSCLQQLNNNTLSNGNCIIHQQNPPAAPTGVGALAVGDLLAKNWAVTTD